MELNLAKYSNARSWIIPSSIHYIDYIHASMQSKIIYA
jgi:hypothetical protein